jgi:hypothetical protein
LLKSILLEENTAVSTLLRDEVSQKRQEKAGPIIDLMRKHALQSLLPRGTETWQKSDSETEIDLILASEELALSVIKCATHDGARFRPLGDQGSV